MGEARARAGFAGEGAEKGRGEEQEGDHGGDGVAGEAEEGERGGIWCARWELAEDGGLAGLDADAGEVEGGAALGEGLLDEIVFAGGDAAGEQQQVAGLLRSVEKRPEVVEVVAGDAEADGFAAGECDQRGEAVAVGVADLVGLRGGVDLDQFVAGGEDGDAGPAKTSTCAAPTAASAAMCAAVRRVPAAMSGSPRRASLPAGTMWLPGRSLRSGWRRILPSGDLDVFEHDDGVGAFGDGCAGHDFERGAGGERRGRRGFASAENAGYGKPVASDRGLRPGRRSRRGWSGGRAADRDRRGWERRGRGGGNRGVGGARWRFVAEARRWASARTRAAASA